MARGANGSKTATLSRSPAGAKATAIASASAKSAGRSRLPCWPHDYLREDWFDWAAPLGRLCSRDRAGLFRQADTPKNRQHQHSPNQSERRHEIKIIAPASIEERAQKITRQTPAEILKRIDHTGSKPGHFCSANIHGCSGSEDRVPSVSGK